MKDMFNKLKDKVLGKDKKPSEAYNAFIASDLSKYKVHEYVLFTDDGVVDHGFDLHEMLEEFRKKYPNSKPFVAKVPPKKFATI